MHSVEIRLNELEASSVEVFKSVYAESVIQSVDVIFSVVKATNSYFKDHKEEERRDRSDGI